MRKQRYIAMPEMELLNLSEKKSGFGISVAVTFWMGFWTNWEEVTSSYTGLLALEDHKEEDGLNGVGWIPFSTRNSNSSLCVV
ncbi:unnamed protein product [Angiostrongylus costaricensis]|uniref:Uncharacterized protein n=1 Tax=Angiostrongylus costaricensis TaxID=334426 RepID=A0A0R3PLY4_ANGCS|nr:unnamed protein product [Angiostrongylus costaricensis]